MLCPLIGQTRTFTSCTLIKGRFVVHRIKPKGAEYELFRVRLTVTGQKDVPYLTTPDGRTIRYYYSLVKVNDTITLDIVSSQMKETIKFDTGNLMMFTCGHNLGRGGTIINKERHPSSFDIVHIKDVLGYTSATRLPYLFVIGKGNKPWISLPRGKGVKLTIAEQRDRIIATKTQ